MSKKTPKVPAAPTVAGDVQDAYNALPTYYAAQQQYGDLFGSLNLSQLNALINGNDTTPGLIDQYSNLRTSQLADVNRLAPQVSSAMRAANPNQYGLLDSLNSSANEQMALGGNLSPDQIRNMQQASRAAAASRGLSGSNMAIADELYRQFDLGNQLQQQRQNYSLGVGNLNQAASVDPFAAILGAGDQIMQQGMVQQAAASPLAQLLGYAHDNQMTAYNAQASANNAKANNKSGLFGGALSAAGSILGKK